MRTLKIYIALSVSSLITNIFPPAACADIIKLKSGAKIEGKITEKNAQLLKIDYEGIILTYFLEDIESIDGRSPFASQDTLDTRQQIKQGPDEKPGVEDASVIFNNGISSMKKEEYTLALSDFNKAIELKPDMPEAYFNRGLVHLRKKDFVSALSDFNKAIELKPDMPEAY
ncbi:MAG: tetratricopeptide repeat protein, partial [Candidatus Omnitrophota bacterium]